MTKVFANGVPALLFIPVSSIDLLNNIYTVDIQQVFHSSKRMALLKLNLAIFFS